MADWQTISSLATAGGTLILAVATFSAVRSSNRSARIAEQSMLTAMRPLLVASLADDPAHKVVWRDRHVARVAGGRAVAELEGDVVYLAMGLRNVGSGIAVLHGWYPIGTQALSDRPRADPGDFRRLTIDLYVPPGGSGYWESALRDTAEPIHGEMTSAVKERRPFTVELLYGDQEGGQRTISRFLVLPGGDDGWYCQAARHWNLDRPDPR